MQTLAVALFSAAVAHTFSVGFIHHWGQRFKSRRLRMAFHLLSEVELVFGLWAIVFVTALAAQTSLKEAGTFLGSLSFVEPLFVFAIMLVASTRPILKLAERAIQKIADLFGQIPALSKLDTFYPTTLIVGPLLGSFITEPAAMTVCALLLRDRYFTPKHSTSFKYFTLALLFVHVSIGGVLTPFAAPPVLMVAKPWNLDLPFMLSHFGWKAALAIALNTLAVVFFFKKELQKSTQIKAQKNTTPLWVTFVHLLGLVGVVVFLHEPLIFLLILAALLTFVHFTSAHQEEIRFKQALFVSFFLAGVVVLGNPQQFWLQPLFEKLDALTLFLSTTALTAITDNALLTYLGSLVPNLSEASKLALLEGAVAGGGLTVIANAPNPAGYSILNDRFGTDGIHPGRLLVSALLPTLVAMAFFWFLP